MTLSLSDLIFLTSAAGENLLADLAHENLSEQNALKLITTLRKTYSSEQVSAALTMARLRLQAVDKFGSDAAALFFTDEALQQASDPLVRHYRAQGAGGQRVLDVCCGIGADSLAFAQAGAAVHGLDIDLVRVALAQYNTQRLGLTATFEVRDVTTGIPDDADWIFFDPARRDAERRRIFDVEQYIPPLSLIKGWHAPHITVKLSPGVDIAQVEKYGGEIQFISVGGEMKEALLTIGGEHAGLCAVLITRDGVYHWRGQDAEPEVAITEPRGWLCEPDPAILRANLVQDVAGCFNGTMLDETIAYFTTPDKPDSCWVRAWHIIDWMPFNLKQLRAYLRERHIGTITVKKRGSPITPEELTQQLKLKGDASCTIVLTRYCGEPIAIICENIVGD